PRDEDADADAEEAAVAEGEGEGGEEGDNTENSESLNNDHGSGGGGGGDNHCRSNESSSSNGNRLCGWDSRYPTIRLPTKRYDGGMNAQDRQLLHQMEVNVGSADPTTSTTARAANDSFQTFSNIDTRMRELLGLEPVANPNDADQQEDWRQLTGFLGLGGRRGQRGGNNGNQENNAAVAVDAEAQQEQQQAEDPDQGGNDGGTSPERRTRLSWELHMNAYMSMWDQRGELELPVPEPDREPEPEPDNNDDGHEEDERRDIGRR
ncbi:hypothetical protein ACHAWC_009740, partial [Mediolabrus comicus]